MLQLLKILNIKFLLVSRFRGRKEYIDSFKSASGFIRREIGQRIVIRFTPEFTFCDR